MKRLSDMIAVTFFDNLYIINDKILSKLIDYCQYSIERIVYKNKVYKLIKIQLNLENNEILWLLKRHNKIETITILKWYKFKIRRNSHGKETIVR